MIFWNVKFLETKTSFPIIIVGQTIRMFWLLDKIFTQIMFIFKSNSGEKFQIIINSIENHFCYLLYLRILYSESYNKKVEAIVNVKIKNHNWIGF